MWIKSALFLALSGFFKEDEELHATRKTPVKGHTEQIKRG
jgi:hypothetical protein